MFQKKGDIPQIHHTLRVKEAEAWERGQELEAAKDQIQDLPVQARQDKPPALQHLQVGPMSSTTVWEEE